jgi:hypothetical protein
VIVTTDDAIYVASVVKILPLRGTLKGSGTLNITHAPMPSPDVMIEKY